MSATLTTPKTTSGGEIIRELVNASDGQGLHFDGAAGLIDIASPPDLGTKFSMEFIAQADAWADSAYKYLVDFGNGGRFIIGTDVAAGAKLAVYDNTSWKTFGVTPLDDLKVHHLVVTIDGTAAILYDNGNQVGTATISASHAIDSCADAKLASSYDGSANFNGTLYRTRFWNKTLTQAEVTASYENATVPFADQYGSQTSLVDAAASVFTSGTYSWVKDGSNTIANVSNTLAITYVNSATGAYNYLKDSSDLTTDLTVGKKYRLTVDAKYTGGSSGARLKLNDGVSNSYSANLTTSLVNYTMEFTAQTPTGAAGYLQLDGMSASNVVTIDNWYVREIGVVSDYDLAFANPTQSLMVQDRAGAADGTSSATGVVQVTPIEQLNSKSARIGTSAATPADGEIIGGGLKLGGGVINHEASDASSIVVCGGNASSTTGANITVGGSSGSASRSVIFKSNATETARIDSAGVTRLSQGTTLTTLATPALMVGGNGTDAYALNAKHLIGFGYNATNTPLVAMGLDITDQAGNTKGSLIFATRDTTGATDVPTTRLVIDSAGTVHVGPIGGAGNAVIAGTSSPSYTNQPGTNLLLKSGDGSGTGSSFITLSTSPAGSSGTTVNTAVERMRIDSAGLVSIDGAKAAGAFSVGSATRTLTGSNSFAIAPAGAVTVSGNESGFIGSCASATVSGYRSILVGLDNTLAVGTMSANETLSVMGGSVAIGATSAAASSNLQVHETGSGDCLIVVSNDTTTIGDTSGFAIGIEADEGAVLMQREADRLNLGTSGVARVSIAADGLTTVYNPSWPLKNELTNSGFGVWSNSTLENVATIEEDDCASDDTGDWTKTRMTLAFDTDHYTYTATGTSSTVTLEGASVSYTAGKLYKISVDVAGSDASVTSTFQIWARAGSVDTYSPEITTTASFVTHTLVVEADSTTTSGYVGLFDATDFSSAGHVKFKNFKLTEVTPGCVNDGNGFAADTHGKDSTLDCFREHWNGSGGDSDTTKTGSFYALRTLNGATDRSYYLTAAVEQDPTFLKRIAGRTVTLGAWVKTSTASHARLGNYDGSSYEHSAAYCAGDGNWHWMELTRTFPAAATYGRFFFHINVNSATAYFSQPMLVFGSAIGEGNYSAPSGEIVWLELMKSSDNYDDFDGISSSTAINTEADTGGKIPKGAKAVYVTMAGSCASTEKYLALADKASGNRGIWAYSQVANGRVANSGWVPCDSNGDILWERNDTFNEVYLWYSGVQLR